MNLDKLKEDANEEIARRQARLMPFNWDPEPEEVLALIEVAEKAQQFLIDLNGTDEAIDKAESALRSALSRLEESK